jgi:hypothetical protein
MQTGYHSIEAQHFENGGGANMVVWYKGADTDDSKKLIGDEIYHTHEQAKTLAESVHAADSNPGGATTGNAGAPFLIPL